MKEDDLYLASFEAVFVKKMRGFCENFRFSANLDLENAKRKRSERSLIFCEAKRIRFAFEIFAIKRTSHCECTPLVGGKKKKSVKSLPFLLFL